MATSPHYFIGIPLQDETKQEISDWQMYLKKELESNYQTWTHKKDFHITLKFLGEVDTNQITDLQKELKKLTELPSFRLSLGGIGTFGKPRKPRVLWAGVEDNHSLETLKNQVEESSQNAGFLKDTQPYRPHITLAKKWKGEKLSKEKLNQFTEEINHKIEMDITSFSLFQIRPSKLPKYEEILKIRLK